MGLLNREYCQATESVLKFPPYLAYSPSLSESSTDWCLSSLPLEIATLYNGSFRRARK